MLHNPEGPGYFGPPHLRKEWEKQVATPIGKPCLHCEEAIVEGDIGTVNYGGQIMHYECGMRGVIGSVGHQNRTCSCYGGTEEDPPGMTRRQAAQAACALWERRQFKQPFNK